MNKVNRSSTATEKFGQTAVKLSQGPLGIIALFIVLIYGFASLVLGFADTIGDANRSILVWFLVLFPVFVFTVFAWLVSTCHQKLYPPEVFRDQKLFYDLAYGQASFDKQDSQANPPTLVMSSLKKSATGNLYWLGHDLMWTADTLLRQGPTEQVLIGLDQAIHHLVHVGLQETPIEYALQALHAQIRILKELPASLRDEYANEIGSIIDKIGATLEAAQPDFQVPPHWNRTRSQPTS